MRAMQHHRSATLAKIRPRRGPAGAIAEKRAARVDGPLGLSMIVSWVSRAWKSHPVDWAKFPTALTGNRLYSEILKCPQPSLKTSDEFTQTPVSACPLSRTSYGMTQAAPVPSTIGASNEHSLLPPWRKRYEENVLYSQKSIADAVSERALGSRMQSLRATTPAEGENRTDADVFHAFQVNFYQRWPAVPHDQVST
eukprot:CAMPEP_0181205136 /NCGR_PEP_ID=MMETSP1096-20121128/20306_1 /TAXON_ID=156174 ORGANISM="Chrysochromulina ericina, Strain CCMP281" /NCGR_SAMPLE_ID=MMETSP1096 /ASSEMBLY_ACC=CAM_ASM_000453 /LENGTH=195 /DNA_ID=CAMNT_0023295879 /DNA_START=762 /DNA_END=1352 /DNA_ORIENTATION=-